MEAVEAVEAVDALIEALGVQVDVGRHILASQLSYRSPCPAWSVRDVINHSIGVTLKLTDFASGRTDRPRTPGGDLLGADHRVAVCAAASAARTAWTQADMRRRCYLPFGTFSATEAVRINLFDVLAHTWDMATGSSIGVGCPDELWQAALDAAMAVIGTARDAAHYGVLAARDRVAQGSLPQLPRAPRPQVDEGLLAVLRTQVLSSSGSSVVEADFWSGTYEALDR